AARRGQRQRAAAVEQGNRRRAALIRHGPEYATAARGPARRLTVRARRDPALASALPRVAVLFEGSGGPARGQVRDDSGRRLGHTPSGLVRDGGIEPGAAGPRLRGAARLGPGRRGGTR